MVASGTADAIDMGALAGALASLADVPAQQVVVSARDTVHKDLTLGGVTCEEYDETAIIIALAHEYGVATSLISLSSPCRSAPSGVPTRRELQPHSGGLVVTMTIATSAVGADGSSSAVESVPVEQLVSAVDSVSDAQLGVSLGSALQLPATAVNVTSDNADTSVLVLVVVRVPSATDADHLASELHETPTSILNEELGVSIEQAPSVNLSPSAEESAEVGELLEELTQALATAGNAGRAPTSTSPAANSSSLPLGLALGFVALGCGFVGALYRRRVRQEQTAITTLLYEDKETKSTPHLITMGSCVTAEEGGRAASIAVDDSCASEPFEASDANVRRSSRVGDGDDSDDAADKEAVGDGAEGEEGEGAGGGTTEGQVAMAMGPAAADDGVRPDGTLAADASERRRSSVLATFSTRRLSASRARVGDVVLAEGPGMERGSGAGAVATTMSSSARAARCNEDVREFTSAKV